MSVSLRFKATAIAVTAFLSCSVVAAQQKPTIFVYGDSNTFGWVYEPKTQVVSRLPVDETWPYFMNRELGNKYHWKSTRSAAARRMSMSRKVRAAAKFLARPITD